MSLRSIEFIVVVVIGRFNFDKIFAISKNAGQATRWRWDRSRGWCGSFSQFFFKSFSNKRSKVLNDSDGQGLSVQRVGGGSQGVSDFVQDDWSKLNQDCFKKFSGVTGIDASA